MTTHTTIKSFEVFTPYSSKTAYHQKLATAAAALGGNMHERFSRCEQRRGLFSLH